MSAISEISDRRSDVRDQKSEIGHLSSAVDAASSASPSSVVGRPTANVAILTGGGDKPYALGMAAALTANGMTVDFIGSDELDVPEVADNPRVNFLNLRGDQRPEVSPIAKALRVLKYYAKLFTYAAMAKPKLFHILWNNKIQLFDRTLLMLYYRSLGKRIVLTAHNVNVGTRDLSDSWLNRLSLKIQYKLCDHVFVHTPAMKEQLIAEFDMADDKVTVVPFGINNTVPNTDLSSSEAKEKLGINAGDKTMLFFGNIAPYKGLEYLINAFVEVARENKLYRLIIVGKPKGREKYWASIKETITRSGIVNQTIQVINYVPDETTELYFKAADLLVLPYTQIFQSGVLFLGYSFGLPAIAANVGSLREEIIEGRTGYTFWPKDVADLAQKIEQYFKSDLFLRLETTRVAIKTYANERYSWDKVAAITTAVYWRLVPETRSKSEVRGQK
jgi:glycosyltransferase involved in cell wall biosynthesis